MREHIKAFLLASSLAFGIPTFVEAEPLELAPEKLDLTETQRDRIFHIFHDQAAATREQMKRVHRAREALRQAESEMASMRAETLRRVASVLSPEQREKLALFQSQSKALRDFTLG